MIPDSIEIPYKPQFSTDLKEILVVATAEDDLKDREPVECEFLRKNRDTPHCMPKFSEGLGPDWISLTSFRSGKDLYPSR